MIVDVVIPTLGMPHAIDCLASLKHLPFPIKLHLITEGKSWPEAVNIGLMESTGDVLLMDDDIRLLPETFQHFDKYKEFGDEIGFKLVYPDGVIQHAGGIMRKGQMGHIGWRQQDNCYNITYYVCHLTTSLVYIKRKVIDAIGFMAEDYPGYQFEDVDFSFRALKAGMKLLYVPNRAIHLESASKSHFDDFQEKLNKNYEEFKSRHLTDPEFIREAESYPREYGIASF